MAAHWMNNAAIMEETDELRRLMLEGNQEEAEKVVMRLTTAMMKADHEELMAEGIDLGRVCTVCGCKEVFQDRTEECCWKHLRRKCVFPEATRERVCTVCEPDERLQDKTDECCWKILKKKCVFEEATRDREQTSGSDGTDHRQAPSRPTRGKNVNRWKRAVAADLDAKSQHYSPESGSAIATGSASRE